MKKLLLLLFVFAVSFFGYAQTKTVDSILVKDILKECDSIEFSQPKKALKLYKEAYSISIKSNYNDGAFKSTLYSGLVYSNMAQYDSALYYYDKAKELNKFKIPLNYALVYLNKANAYMFKGELDKSLEYHIKGIKLLEEEKNRRRLEGAYVNISAVFGQLDDHDKQIEYLKKALNITAPENTESFGLTHGDLALIYLEKDDLDTAFFHLKKADSLSKLIKSPMLDFFTTRNWGEYYLKNNNNLKSISFLEKALSLSKASNYSYYEKELLLSLGEVYIGLNEFDKAEKYLLEAIEKSEKIGVKEFPKKAFFFLSQLNEKKGNYNKAYNYLSKYNILKDSLISESHVDIVNELEVKYQTEKKDKTILENEIKLEKSQAKTLTMTILIISLLLASILLWFVFQQRQKRIQQQLVTIQKEQEVLTLESLIAGEEKERLRIAKELHDGVNGDLSAIKYKLSSLLKMNNEVINEAVVMIDNSCKQVRAISHNLVPPSLKDFNLIEAISNYCENMNSTHDPEISFQHIGDSIDLNKKVEVNIFRIIQELVTNAIKHAKAKAIDVQISNRNNTLLITVEDNGDGYAFKDGEANGIGMSNIKSRVEYLNANLEVITNKNGTSNTVEIDLKKINDN